MTDRLLKIATVVAPHGIRGEVRVKTFLEDVDSFHDFAPFTDNAGVPIGPVVVRGKVKGMLIARVGETHDRNAAEALRGLNLFVPRDKLPVIEEGDEFYYDDLIGLDILENGRKIGTVKAMREHGAGDLVEILDLDGKVDLFAFSQENFPDIDLTAGTLSFVRPTDVISQDDKGQVH